MKYGLIYYKDTDNLGDDILTFAGKRFLPRVDYVIDRENMDLFMPEEKEYVAALLNGWYIHYSYTFPPSPYLLPLFIGTHFNQDTMIYGDYSYLDGFAAEYLKKQEPVGCRDLQTMEVLRQKGIDSYFSGCLTLTLQKYPDVKPNHTVFLTDVSEEILEYAAKLLPGKEIKAVTHRFTEEERGWEDWQKREERLETFLRMYQGADLVITRRLHCALPCIALGTPVLLVVNNDADFHDRIECFTKYCMTCTEEELLSGKADGLLREPRQNQSTEELVCALQARIQEFVDRTLQEKQDISLLPELSVYRELFVERGSNMRKTIQILMQRQYDLQMEYRETMAAMENVMALAQRLADMHT